MTKIKSVVTFLLAVGTLSICNSQDFRIRIFTTTIGNGIATKSCDVLVYSTIDEFAIYQYGINIDGSPPDFSKPAPITYKYKRIGDLETGTDAIGIYIEANYKINNGRVDYYRKLKFYDTNNLLIEEDIEKSKKTYYLTENAAKKFQQLVK